MKEEGRRKKDFSLCFTAFMCSRAILKEIVKMVAISRTLDHLDCPSRRINPDINPTVVAKLATNARVKAINKGIV